MGTSGHDFRPSGADVSEQALAVLALLKESPRTTTELRLLTGTMSPAARVLDLRRAGHRIATCRAGRQACYVLRGAEA
jgi:hypothetical protein